MAAPVIICDYDPLWPATFSEIRALIAPALGDVALTVEHVGSTSVPGLAAKPIIDIDVAVAGDVDVREAINRLARIGYIHEGDQGIPGREAFEAPAGLPKHHLYVCRADNREYRRHLVFRDYLRSQPDVAHEYGDLKRRLAEQYRNDRDGYTNAKGEFIERVLARAGWRD